MIFTEDQINNNYGVDAFDILSEASYVDGLDIISPTTIPMAENSSVGGIVVRFSDVESLAEETGLDYIDTMLLIAEEHDLDPAYMAVAVDESEVIVNPEIIEELANVVIVPQSENSLAYQFCEACLDSFIESGDEEYLLTMIDEDVLLEKSLLGYAGDALGTAWDGLGDGLRYANKKGGKILDNVKSNWDKARGRDTDLLSRKIAMQQDQLATTNKMAKNALKNYDDAVKNNDYTNITNKKNIADMMQGKLRGEARDLDSMQKSYDYANKEKWKSRGKLAGGALALGAVAGAYANRHKIAKGVKSLFGKDNGQQSNQASAVEDKMQAILKQAQGKPKSWIGKKIAALRGMYSQWLQRANRERDAGRAGVFKKIASTIMNCIDALMQKLQNFAG